MGEARSHAELCEWLAVRIAQILERPADQISPHATFAEQGMDSMSTMMLCGDIEDEFGLDLEPQVAWNHRTIDALGGYLFDQLATVAR